MVQTEMDLQSLRKQCRRKIGKIRSSLLVVKERLRNIIPDGNEETVSALEAEEEKLEDALKSALEAEQAADEIIQVSILTPIPSPRKREKQEESSPKYHSSFEDDDMGPLYTPPAAQCPQVNTVKIQSIVKLQLPSLSDALLLKAHFTVCEKLIQEIGGGAATFTHKIRSS